ncbi:DUF502 domain-containing protein [Candidatus Pyrohabitans sp.]
MKLLQSIRNTFLAGLIVFIPLVATIYVLWFGFDFLDSLLRPLLKRILGMYLPGFGVIATLLLIFALGALARLTLGKRLVAALESALMRIPLIKTVYATVKHASKVLIDNRTKGFKGVVLVEYPRRGSYVIGFTTGANVEEVQQKTKENVINVFVPTAPNPTSGFVIMVPEEEVIPLEMSVEEGLKLIVSGGFVMK